MCQDLVQANRATNIAVDSEHNLAHGHISPSVHTSHKCRKCYTWKYNYDAAVIDVEVMLSNVECVLCHWRFKSSYMQRS